ncbi:MAG: hypothetical protein GW790_06305, partial [Rhodoferax sp.]|nr:hypothetical protein [Rhodoferax sp.]
MNQPSEMVNLMEPLTPQTKGIVPPPAVSCSATPATLPLTALDLAFADFLQASEPSTDPRHSLLAALTSHQYGRGHACLDLRLLAEFGGTALGWDARLQDLLPSGLADAAASLPWTQGSGSPLVLEDTRLYLRRNWQAEQAIRASIQARLNQPGA